MSRNKDRNNEEQKLEEKSNLKGDYINFAILLGLYFMQGIVSGISMTIPILLQNRQVTYKQQAIFSISNYPFSLKVLWSPIVDSLYFTKIGRRKSWVIPFEVLSGLTLILWSNQVNVWLGDGHESIPDVISLTLIFFSLRMFTATHDIAVDGWALSMLQKRNVGHVATAEAVGATAGFYTGYMSLLILESKEFCNSYIFSEPRDQGLITLSGFMKFWGVIFLITATCIAFFKREDSEMDEKLREYPDYGVKKAYPTLLNILKLKPIIRLSIFLLTVKITFGAVDSMTFLKLVDYGIPKDKIALLSIPILPIQIILSFIISRYTTGRFPLTFYMKAFKLRIFVSILFYCYLYATPKIIGGDSNLIPWYFYLGITAIYLLYQFPFRSMFVADTAFFARVSDPLIGGTYLTLLNTIGNIGVKWPHSFSLWLVDYITWKECIWNENSFTNSTESFILNTKCENKEAKDVCINNGGSCHTIIDGYYIEGAFYAIYGIIFYQFGKRVVNYLEGLPLDDWHILSKKVNTHERERLNAEESL